MDRNRRTILTVSTFGFALRHPLIFGVNNRGDSGWLGFTGTFIAVRFGGYAFINKRPYR